MWLSVIVSSDSPHFVEASARNAVLWQPAVLHNKVEGPLRKSPPVSSSIPSMTVGRLINSMEETVFDCFADIRLMSSQSNQA